MDPNSQFQQANQNLAGQLPQAPPVMGIGYSPLSFAHEQSGVEAGSAFINAGTTAGALVTAGMYAATPHAMDPVTWGRRGGGMARTVLGGTRGRSVGTLANYLDSTSQRGFLRSPVGAARWLGRAGLRGGSAAVLGTAGGAAAAMAAYGIAPALVGAAVNTAVEGSREYVTTRELARDLQITPQGGSQWGPNSIFREQSGYNYAQHLSGDNNRHLQNTISGAAGNLGVSTSQMRNLTSSMGRAGMLDTSSVERIRDSLKEGVAELQEMSKLVGLDLDQAMEMYKSLDKLGFRDKVSRSKALKRMAGASQMTGLSLTSVAEVVAGGQAIAGEVGTSRDAAGNLALSHLSSATTRLAMGDIDRDYLDRVGGVSGYALRMTQLQTGLQDSAFGTSAMTQMFNPDGSARRDRKGLLGMGADGTIEMDRKFLEEVDPYQVENMRSKASPILSSLALYAVERARGSVSGASRKNQAQYAFMSEELGIEDPTEQLEFLQAMRTRNYGAFSEAHQQSSGLAVDMGREAEELKGIWSTLMKTLGDAAKDTGEFFAETLDPVNAGLRNAGAATSEFFSRNQLILARERGGFSGSMDFGISTSEFERANTRFRDGTSSFYGLEGLSLSEAIDEWDAQHGGVLRGGADMSMDYATMSRSSGGALDRLYRGFVRPRGPSSTRREDRWMNQSTRGLAAWGGLAADISGRRVSEYESNFISQIGGHLGQDGEVRFSEEGLDFDILDRDSIRQDSAIREMVTWWDAVAEAGAEDKRSSQAVFMGLSNQLDGELWSRNSLVSTGSFGTRRVLRGMTEGMSGEAGDRLAVAAATREIDPSSAGAQRTLDYLESTYGTDSAEYRRGLGIIAGTGSGGTSARARATSMGAYARESSEGHFSDLVLRHAGVDVAGGSGGLFGQAGIFEGVSIGTGAGEDLAGQAAGMALGRGYLAAGDRVGASQQESHNLLQEEMRRRLGEGNMASIGAFVTTAMAKDKDFDVVDYFGLSGKEDSRYRDIQEGTQAYQDSGLADMTVGATGSVNIAEIRKSEEAIGLTSELQADAVSWAIRADAQDKILRDRQGDTLRAMDDISLGSLSAMAQSTLGGHGSRGRDAIAAINKLARGDDMDSLSESERELATWGLGQIQASAGEGTLVGSKEHNESIASGLGIFAEGDSRDILQATAKSFVSDDGAISSAIASYGGEFAQFAAQSENLRTGRSKDAAADTEEWLNTVLANMPADQAEAIRQQVLGYDTSGDGTSFTTKSMNIVAERVLRGDGTLGGMDLAELNRSTLSGLSTNPNSPAAKNEEAEKKLMQDHVRNIKDHLDSIVNQSVSILVTDSKTVGDSDDPATGSGNRRR